MALSAAMLSPATGFFSCAVLAAGKGDGPPLHKPAAGNLSRGKIPRQVDIEAILRADPFDPKRGEGRFVDTGAGLEKEEEIAKKYLLYGLLASGDFREAYLGLRSEGRRQQQERELRKIVPGDMVDGWKVKEIGNSGVRLVSGDKEVFLKVFQPDKPGRKVSKPVAQLTPKTASGDRRILRPSNKARRSVSRSVNRLKPPKPVKPARPVNRKRREGIDLPGALPLPPEMPGFDRQDL